jgi:hypothetical protein
MRCSPRATTNWFIEFHTKGKAGNIGQKFWPRFRALPSSRLPAPKKDSLPIPPVAIGPMGEATDET